MNPTLWMEAKHVDPRPFLTSYGYFIKNEGRHCSVRNIQNEEVYRLTQSSKGWIWCDKLASQGGDNVDLIKKLALEHDGQSISNIQALRRLTGKDPYEMTRNTTSQMAYTKPMQARPLIVTYPSLPPTSTYAQQQGRAYLHDVRCISYETIEHAEKSGMVKYGPDCVLFCGYDIGENGGSPRIRNVTKRAASINNPEKRDLRFSDKTFPPILPGDPALVWIVEGGTDALALQDLMKRHNKQPPMVIVSGGANALKPFDNPQVQRILLQSRKIFIAVENEKDSITQAKTDAAHLRQYQRIAEIRKNQPPQEFLVMWKPDPAKGKDLADLNEKQVRHQLQMQQYQSQQQHYVYSQPPVHIQHQSNSSNQNISYQPPERTMNFHQRSRTRDMER